MAETTKAFVIGHPIAHSRSPLIHGYWLESHGMSGTYERIDIAPEDLERFIRNLPESGFVGGNVTIPHKEETCRLVDRLDEAARAIGAVNTLWLDGGAICGGNTDATGFAADLDVHASSWRSAKSALVLGAGGASRAILHALTTAGIADIRLVNRTFARAEEVSERFGTGIQAHHWQDANDLASTSDLVVNTTSVGLNGQGEMPLDVAQLSANATVVDIVYTPLQTPLLAAAAKRGLKTVDGLGMLLHQAVPGFERWFGVRPEVTDRLRGIIVADIEGARS